MVKPDAGWISADFKGPLGELLITDDFKRFSPAVLITWSSNKSVKVDLLVEEGGSSEPPAYGPVDSDY